MTDTRRRVKVYNLNDDRQWDDRGTGHVSSAYVERLKGMTLIVRSEQDGTLLLESRILPNTAYQKQQETLIVWSEGESTDLALSFQEKAGCDEIWEKICEVQGKDPSVDITQDIVEDDEDDPPGRLDVSSESLQRQASPCVLPPCELGELEEIAELFNSSLPSPLRRDQLARAIEGSDYIIKLLAIFRTCEDLEDMESLHKLFEIFKSLFLLNRSSLFDVMLQEDNIMDVVGCLEYDPTASTPQKHRDYLLREVSFKEVLPIKNGGLLKKIHQTFRLQYIQDVVLPTPSVFEENLLSTLSSIIFFNKVEIVNMIREDKDFLSSIFKLLQDEDVSDLRKVDLAGFIRELCALSQTLQPMARDDFFRQLGALGILPATELLLSCDDARLQRLGVDIFAHVVEHSPSMVREFARKEASGGDNEGEDEVFLLNLVIEQMIYDPDPELGRATQVASLLRLIVDPESMIANKNEKTEFLAFFYRNCMHVLMAPLLANTAGESPGKDDYQTAHMLSLILELLTFSVEHHTYNIKNYILSKDLLRRILVLLRSRHMFLCLSALRFMRKIVGMSDEFYNRYIVRGNLFTPVVDSLFNSGNRYNLLNSTILEMFEFIRMENVKSLVACVVEEHHSRLQKISYTKIFAGIKLRHDQEMSRCNRQVGSLPSSETNRRFRKDARELDEEEELWFDKEDDVDFADSFESPKINIDSVLGEAKPEALKLAEDTPGAPLKSNGSCEGTGSGDAERPLVGDMLKDGSTVKNGLVGLVDYPDDDSEEDESSGALNSDDVAEECGESVPKKPRLSPSTDD